MMGINIDHNDQLAEYLQAEMGISPDQIISVQTLTGGVSNRTKLLSLSNGSSWVIKQALTQLRVDGDWRSEPHRVLREAAALRWFDLSQSIITPAFIHEDPNEFIVIMEAIRPPFVNFKDWLMAENYSENYINQSGELLGVLHSESIQKTDLIPGMFYDQHFFETLRLHPYYTESARILPECRSFMEDLKIETQLNSWCLVHGDFSPKNILLKEGKLVLLDHEVIHYGDGCFDLGFFTCHLLSKANHIKPLCEQYLKGVITFYNSYLNQINLLPDMVEQRAIRHCIACLIARVCGLSKLEYLSIREREIQQSIALVLINDPPLTFVELSNQYKTLLNEYH